MKFSFVTLASLIAFATAKPINLIAIAGVGIPLSLTTTGPNAAIVTSKESYTLDLGTDGYISYYASDGAKYYLNFAKTGFSQVTFGSNPQFIQTDGGSLLGINFYLCPTSVKGILTLFTAPDLSEACSLASIGILEPPSSSTSTSTSSSSNSAAPSPQGYCRQKKDMEYI